MMTITLADAAQMSELEEDDDLLGTVIDRLEANKDKLPIPASEAYERLGIDLKEIAAMGDVELA